MFIKNLYFRNIKKYLNISPSDIDIDKNLKNLNYKKELFVKFIKKLQNK